jgi:hypothetical protein
MDLVHLPKETLISLLEDKHVIVDNIDGITDKVILKHKTLDNEYIIFDDRDCAFIYFYLFPEKEALYSVFATKDVVLDGVENNLYIKSMCFLMRSDSVEVFEDLKKYFVKFVQNCFNLSTENLFFKKHDSIMVVENINNCSILDYIKFIHEMNKSSMIDLENNRIAFWKVDFDNKNVVIKGRHAKHLLTAVPKSKKKIEHCFDHSYKVDVQIECEDECSISDNLSDFWKYVKKDITHTSFDEIRETIYHLLLNHDLLCMKAGVGGSKTVTTVKCLKRYITDVKKIKVLFISNRIVYADSMAQSIQKIVNWTLGSTSREYESIKTSSYTKFPNNIPQLVCQNDIIFMSIESMLKLYQTEFEENVFSKKNLEKGNYIIVLDEVTETLANVYRKTVNNPLRVFTYMCKMIKHAHKVICMSDDITFWSLNFLQNLKSDSDAAYYELTFRKSKHDAILTTSEDLSITSLLSDLNAGKNIIIISGTKKKCQFICNIILKNGLLNEDEILLITSDDNSDYLKKQDIDGWVGYRCVIYSPKITSGVSFDIQNHFHKVYAFLWNRLPVRVYKQMIARVRFLIDKEVIYCFPKQNDNSNNKFCVNKEELQQLIKNCSNNINSLIIQSIEVPDMIVDEYSVFSMIEYFDEYKNLFFNIVVERHNDFNNFTRSMYKHLVHDCGENVVDCDDLINYIDVFPPTEKKNLIVKLDNENLVLFNKRTKYERIIDVAMQLRENILERQEFKIYNRVDAKDKLILTESILKLNYENLKKKRDELSQYEKDYLELCVMILFSCNINAFVNNTNEIVRSLCFSNLLGNMTCIKTWNKIIYSASSRLKHHTSVEDIEYGLIKDTAVDAFVNIKLCAILIGFLTGKSHYDADYEDRLVCVEEEIEYNNYQKAGTVLWEDLIEKTINKTKPIYYFLLEQPSFVYNPFMLCNEEICTFLRENIDTFHLILFGKTKRDDAKHFVKKEAKTFLLKNQNIQYSKKMEFNVGETTMVVVFTIFKMLLKKMFGVSLVQEFKMVQVNGCVERFIEYDVGKPMNEYLEKFNVACDVGDSCRKKIYSISFNKHSIEQVMLLSKSFNTYIMNKNPDLKYIDETDSENEDNAVQRLKKRVKLRHEAEKNLFNVGV